MNERRLAIFKEWEALEARIKSLPPLERAAIALGSAQRLMDEHLAAPEDKRDAFVADWAPTLKLIWSALSNPSPDTDDALRSRLDAYYAGPFCHWLGEEALPGADEHPAAAAIYATEAYCREDAKSAGSAAERLFEAADQKARDLTTARGEDLMSPEAEAREDLFAQDEIIRLKRAVEIVEHEGVTKESLERLHAVFTAQLPAAE